MRVIITALLITLSLIDQVKCFAQTEKLISPASPTRCLRSMGPRLIHPSSLRISYLPKISNRLSHGVLDQSQTKAYFALRSVAVSSMSMIETIFSTTHTVPLYLSLLLNSSLFFILRSKLNQMLTPEGFAHSLVLGTMLWHTLGWRGWSTCVLYLILGQVVTKVKFLEKQAKGIAEGRGGRRGPENVWYVVKYHIYIIFLT